MTRRANTRSIFIAAIVLLAVCAIGTGLSFVYFRKSEKLVSHTQEVRAILGDQEAATNSAARARMSYLLSGNPADLTDYQASKDAALEKLTELRELTKDNSLQSQNCSTLDAVTRNRIRTWEESIEQKKQGLAIDAIARLPQNVQLAEESATAAQRIRDREEQLLARRSQAAHQRFLLATVLVCGSFAFSLGLLWYYYQLLSNELVVRREAERAAQEAFQREAAFRRDEQRFRLFIQAVRNYAIFTLDENGNVSSWNEGAERLKGYEASEILGKNFSSFFPEEDLKAGKPQRELETATKEGRAEDEGWRVRKDGSRFWANVTITAIQDDNGKLAGFVKITRDFTDRMRAQEALQRGNTDLVAEVASRKAAEIRLANSEKSLRDLSLHLLRSQDEERKRIGRDLHDSLGQYLAVLKMNLDTLESTVNGTSEEAERQLMLCIRLAEDALKEVRTISYLLYPPLLEEMGLRSAIPWYLEGFSKRSNIQTSFEADSDFGRMPPEAELALFRILQESLTNVHRHSGSANATVRLQKKEGHAVLEVADNGKGMSKDLLQQVNGDWMGSLGVGLRGMSERVGQLGGHLEITSLDAGTLVRATVPLGKQVSNLIRSA